MAYGDFKDTNRTKTTGKVLHDKAFNIVKNPKYDRYQRGFASMVSKCLDKKKILVEHLKIKVFLIKN